MKPTKEQKLAIIRLQRALKNIKEKGMTMGASSHNTVYIYDKKASEEFSLGIINDQDDCVLDEISL